MKKINKDTFFVVYISIWAAALLVVYTCKWFDPQYVTFFFLAGLFCLLPVKHKLFIE